MNTLGTHRDGLVKKVAVGSIATIGSYVAGKSLAQTIRPNGQTQHASESVEHYEHAHTRILILGGGFGGLMTALQLDRLLGARSDVSILLVDRGSTQLFYPLLWTVADGRASPNDAMVPLRALQRGRSFHLLHAEIEGIDLDQRTVQTSAGTRPYDILVLALGSVTSVPDVPGLRDHSLQFHSATDALQLRNHVINALEMAHQCEDAEERQAWLTFVVGGGGDTGCELTAIINDYVTGGLRKEYPWLVTTSPRVVVVEQESRLLPLSKEEVSAEVQRLLIAQGVDVRTDAKVEKVTDREVHTTRGAIPSHTLFWAAGISAPDVVRSLPVGHERNGALTVDGNLRLPGREEVYVVGDAAWICDAASGAAVPPTAQAAEQEGRYVAGAVAAQVAGQLLPPPFHYSSRGHFTLLGGHTAVDEVGPTVLTGLPAWLLWHGYYLAHIPTWHNRLHLAADWALAALVGRETGQLRLESGAPTSAASD
jgi:NADH dehydrogenase FAD-containing subunit